MLEAHNPQVHLPCRASSLLASNVLQVLGPAEEAVALGGGCCIGIAACTAAEALNHSTPEASAVAACLCFCPPWI